MPGQGYADGFYGVHHLEGGLHMAFGFQVEVTFKVDPTTRQPKLARMLKNN
jgi:hypothetical protein